MPRVAPLTVEGKLKAWDKKVCYKVLDLMKQNHIKQIEVDKFMGSARGTVGNQIARERLTTRTIAAVFAMTNPDAETIKEIMSI